MELFAPHAIDFYKSGHYKQYPDGTEFVYSNWTARSGKYAPDVMKITNNKIVWFGLQAVLKQIHTLWDVSFFSKPKEEVLARYKRRMDTALGEGSVGIEHLSALHDLGYLPIFVKALPEGELVDIRIPTMTIINTDKKFYWITNYLETQISTLLWKLVNNATTAYAYRKLIDHWAEVTGADASFVPWQGHDFSARGMSGLEDGATSGMAHLTSFLGTDTVLALDAAEYYYQSHETHFLGGSVAATEHSVMCMGGSGDEKETIRRLIQTVYSSGIVSIVSDTWDFWKVLSVTAPALKDVILNRKPNVLGLAKVVFRPDSGDPVKIICGDDSAPVGSPACKGAVQVLWEEFGGTETLNGYKLLSQYVGLIYGDSITLERAERILALLAKKGFASSNIVFGIGSYTYQNVTRDTLGQAIKATWGVVNGEKRELFKDPVTDDGIKKSLKGLIRVAKESSGDYVAFDQQRYGQESQGALSSMYANGTFTKEQSMEEIRSRLHDDEFFG